MSVSALDAKLYPGVSANWDDEIFRDKIEQHLQPGYTILDVGAGAGIVSQMNFRGQASRVCGIDPDPRVVENPFLDEGRIAFAEKIPYSAETFNLVFSDNVLEHLENPEAVFAEATRVLKPGGILLVKTPNKFHYVPLIARLTPQSFHRTFNARRGRNVEDTFPTRYLANSRRDFERLARSAGLELVECWRIESRPEYLRFSSITYVIGWLFERLVNSVPFLSGFRVLLIGKFVKPEKSPTGIA